ncbi:Uncharacterised protein [Bordetella ansorpii]|uniref:DUF1963 domain-containing protein n=1 Tax=Bordetella ansorpii TaxID=288768 RepID=A0A157NXL8_9BORD|nr:hypothetical protein [Bordetella ansorpii]SAI25786.1 Uncharacterised protein [Bordetella ansorpii]
MKELVLDEDCHDASQPRIGGGALLGGVAAWPVTASGQALHLIASFPAEFLGLQDFDGYVSVFSVYSKEDYFLDCITYHGDAQEMETLLHEKTTQVLFHARGKEVFGTEMIPCKRVRIRNDVPLPFQGSGFGDPAGLLQNETLGLAHGMRFALQLYGGDFPGGYRDIFGLTDAVGYLYLDGERREGMFFVQVS